MASMNCPQCRRALSTDDLICPACGSLVFRTPPPTPATSGPGQVPAEHLESETLTRRCAQTWCAREFSVDSDHCPACGEPADIGEGLEPNTEVRVRTVRLQLAAGPDINLRPGQSLVIGRECSDARIAAFLDRFDAVSRRHVEVRVGLRDVAIGDLHSTNGTYVDGLRRDEPLTLTAGVHRLRLASSVEIELDIVPEDAP